MEDKEIVDLILYSVKQHSTPSQVIEEVSMILEEKAEIFVMKLWRLLIFKVKEQEIKNELSSST